MSYEHYTHLAVRIDNYVATVSLNRPEVLNAVNAQLHHELSTIFFALAEDPAVSVIVLTGEGRAFCAGGDLDWVQELLTSPRPYLENIIVGRKIVMGILDCPKPIVCRINGDAIGLGATIALLCDITIAVDTASIADPHVRIGLVAGDGGALIWPQLVGYAKAKEYLLTGSRIKAAEAARIGLINYAVNADELDATVQQMVSKLISASPTAIQYTKMSVNVPLRQMVSSVLENSLAYEGLTILQNTDLSEALVAFREKRPPVFKRG
ncbi:enoyl-CoA hydratase/isomerase family protein [Noviherbaspirillum sedimenti]|uniref:Enoyl-CoA hydratase/isomerase family protein n=1 Tax=Noviherbaspirillum sedimenti TaxID=2320865 RepID=A0A3A3G691_9BURK|nr:enoyl-CoA hydratase-related protein [Noviherbaspirillum sedimenti]RJG03185.1 enoyl-CoA hydratase/isomerase family protein [Noviherbaspirillum sedimenti]